MITTSSTDQSPFQWYDFLFRKTDPYAAIKYDILLSKLGSLHGKSALVVGSGSGEFAAFLAKRGAIVTAIDIDQATVDLTKKTAAEFNVSVSTEISILENFNTKKTFDIVAATDVLEHLINDKIATKKLTNLTNKNGCIVITVPALPFLFGYHDKVLGHYRRYTMKSLCKLFDSNTKFELLKYYGFSLILITLLISKIFKKPYPTKKINEAATTKNLIFRALVYILKLESKVSPPCGISLLLIARKS
ncbi:MAG: methyltransferase domain-containing protein [Bdellovibrionota bacterium]